MLTELKIKHAKAGVHADGDGLYLQVIQKAAGAPLWKSWVFRFQLNGRRREMGLGSLDKVSAKEARRKAAEARALLAQQVDPIEHRREMERRKAEAAQAARAGATTFRDVALDYIEAQRAGWKNAKHAQQWRNTLEAYVFPMFGNTPIADIDDSHVLAALKPIWLTKTETATRVRGRIEKILDAARVMRLRQGDNPARWRGHLEHLLQDPGKVAPVKHHPALPFDQMPEFMAELRAHEGVSPLCLEFVILTACRSGEALGARWDEIDEKKAVWTVPPERMKMRKEHRVPLSTAALAVLAKAKALRRGEHVFPGVRTGRPMSDMSLTMLLRDVRKGITVHGFRSTFRDWAAEATEYPNEMAEMALAHAVSNKVEAAYRRGDMFERRRHMMEDWAKHCRPRKVSKTAPAGRR